jgi:hypothetical protein
MNQFWLKGRIALCAWVWSCAWPAATLAYVDPGTGAVLIGPMTPLFIGVGIAVAVVGLKIFWRPLLKLVWRERDNAEDEESS